jgi:hypothetical protein
MAFAAEKQKGMIDSLARNLLHAGERADSEWRHPGRVCACHPASGKFIHNAGRGSDCRFGEPIGGK